MSKHLIGIDIGNRTLRVAILSREKGQVSVKDLAKREFSDPEELSTQLRDLLDGVFRLGDQLVTSLPMRRAYVRNLNFPFQNESKIAAALPFELSAQLPVSIDDCATAIQKPQPVDEGAQVVAAAVAKDAIEALLETFDAAELPLHRVDLAPYCYVAGLGKQIDDGLLVSSLEQELTIALVQDGQLRDYRVLPPLADQAVAAQLPALLREIKVLAHVGGLNEPPISVMGSEQVAELATALQQAGLPVNVLALEIGGRLIEAEFLSATALALKGQTSRAESSFNFRSGPYQLKGEWANLKGKLVLLGVLLGVTVIVLSGSMTLKYLDKAQLAERLQNNMVQVYQSLFPDARTIVDVPLQLQSAIRDLQKKNNLVAGNQISAIAVLREVSRLPEQFTVEIEEFVMDADSLNLTGHAPSFETVNQMAQLLEDSPLFASVQVTDAKMSLDGGRIVFRLRASFSSQEEKNVQ
jgi:general secretion pathway protein L